MSAIPPEIMEAAQSWRLVAVGSQRWMITDADGNGWAPMPRVVGHMQLNQPVAYEAKMAPRAIAAEALDAYRRGVLPPCYEQTADGLVPCAVQGERVGRDDGAWQTSLFDVAPA